MTVKAQSCYTLEALLEGDGRRKIWPGDYMASCYETMYGCKPMPVTRSQACRIHDTLMQHGTTHHSASGRLLWVSLEICRHVSNSYVVCVHKAARRVVGYDVSFHADWEMNYV